MSSTVKPEIIIRLSIEECMAIKDEYASILGEETPVLNRLDTQLMDIFANIYEELRTYFE